MFLLLFKIRLRAWLSQFSRGRTMKTVSGGRKVLMTILFIYVIGVFAVMFYNTFNSLCVPLCDQGLAWLYFAIAGLLAFGLSFIGSVFSTWTQLYDSKDNDLLLSMPIRPSCILASRMAILVFTDLVISLIVLVPAGVVWNASEAVTAAGAVCFVLGVLLMPFFAMIFSSVVGFLVGLATSRAKNRNMVTAVLSLVFLAVYFYVYFNANRFIQDIAANGMSIAGTISRSLFPLYHFGLALGEGRAVSMVIFALCALVPFAVIYMIIAKTYIGTITTKRGASRKGKYKAGETKVRTPKSALLHKELRRYFANPMYMLNAGLGTIICVAGAVVLAFKSGAVAGFAEQMPWLGSHMGWLAAAAVTLLCSMNQLTAPSVSLEGKSIWIIQSLPVPTGDVLEAKARAHIAFCLPPAMLASLSCAIFLQSEASCIPFIFLMPAAFTAFTAYLGVAVNLRFPYLNWINETVAIKQSASAIVTLLVSWAILAVMVVPGLTLASGMSGWIYCLIWTAVFAAAALLVRRYLHKKGAKKFASLG